VSRFLRDFGPVVALVLLFIVGTAMQPQYFLQPENIRNLFSQNVDVGLLAIGMTLVIVTAGIDLSVGSILVLSAAISLQVVNGRVPAGESMAVWFGAVTALGVGMGLGLLNGVLVAYARVAPFVVTLCGLVAYRSAALVIGQSGEIRSSSPDLFPRIANSGIELAGIKTASGASLSIPWSVFALLLVAWAVHFALERTRWGRYLVAVGSNERAAHYAALPVARIKASAYVMMGLLAGASGLFAASRLNSVGTGSLGTLRELDAIAAAVIGGASLSGGKGRIFHTLIGVLILAVINNLLVLQNVSADWQGMVKGAIILLAVLVQREKKPAA